MGNVFKTPEDCYRVQKYHVNYHIGKLKKNYNTEYCIIEDICNAVGLKLEYFFLECNLAIVVRVRTIVSFFLKRHGGKTYVWLSKILRHKKLDHTAVINYIRNHQTDVIHFQPYKDLFHKVDIAELVNKYYPTNFPAPTTISLQLKQAC